jgi:hypothetical protein
MVTIVPAYESVWTTYSYRQCLTTIVLFYACGNWNNSNPELGTFLPRMNFLGCRWYTPLLAFTRGGGVNFLIIHFLLERQYRTTLTSSWAPGLYQDLCLAGCPEHLVNGQTMTKFDERTPPPPNPPSPIPPSHKPDSAGCIPSFIWRVLVGLLNGKESNFSHRTLSQDHR